jgi:hypothetical protein
VTDAWVGSPWILLSKAQIYFTVSQARGLSSTLASVSSDVGLDSTVDKAIILVLHRCRSRVTALLAVRTSDTVRYCNGSGRVVAIVKGSGAYMIGKSGSGAERRVVHRRGS